MLDIQNAQIDVHGSTERALRAWRRGDALLRGCSRAATRAAYEAAIAASLPALRDISSVRDLVRAYYGGNDDIRQVVERACQAQPDGDFLVRALVEDVAFWRRLRDMVTAATVA